MITPPRFGFADFLQLIFVVALAAALRIGYLHVAADDGRAEPAFVVQGDRPCLELPPDPATEGCPAARELDELVRHIHADRSFESAAPLADKEEATAHVAPGYPWFVAQCAAITDPPDVAVRWIQCVLGTLTVWSVFFFARRAFASAVVAFLAGLLAAVHPFWIVNTAELSDGVLATFLLATVLALGTRGSQAGGAFTSLLFGLGLAAAALVRAALLPWTIVALLWFLVRCKHVRYGWFNAILALLGFANGLAPWTVRNWQVFEEPVPIVTSTYLHVWIGNNPKATGGPMGEADLRATLARDRLKELLDEPNQARRYAMLGPEVAEETAANPAATFSRRWQAGMKFLVGDTWFRDQRMSQDMSDREEPPAYTPPEWLSANLEACLQGWLLVMFLLAVLGWRWSYAWKNHVRLATLALVWLPLPYLLSHAEALSGPRLPWDGVLLCFSAYALARLAPSVAGSTEDDE